MKTSVVVSTYNRPRALNLVLEGLSRQSLPPDQIVIGDDGSGADTAKVIDSWRDKGLPIEHCWHEDKGYRKTLVMNRAVARSTSDLLIFLDGDCVPLPSFVADHVLLHQPGFIHAGPRMLASERLTKALESRASIDSLGHLFFLKNRLLGRVNRIAPLIRLPDGEWRVSQPTKWELVRGCNFSVERSSVIEVDGFEGSLFGWGPDDSDIAVRLINSGLKVKSLRFAAPVLHLWHPEESRGNLEQNRSYLRAALESKRVVAQLGISKLPPIEDFRAL